MFSFIFSIWISLSAAAGIHPDYKPVYAPNEAAIFSGQIYTIINHAVGGWDPERITYPGVQKLVAFSKDKWITRFGLVSAYGGNGPQHFAPDDVNFIVESPGGSHRITFPQAQAFLMAGGNLSMCLCEAIRDVIRGVLTSQVPLVRIFLVEDAIYDHDGFWPVGLPQISHFGDKFLLSDLSQKPTDSLKIYFARNLDRKNQYLCPDQDSSIEGPVEASEFSLKIFREGNLITETLVGGKKEIHLIMLSADRLDAVLGQMHMELIYPVFHPF